jgi:hypothetical protein
MMAAAAVIAEEEEEAVEVLVDRPGSARSFPRVLGPP